LEDRGAICHPSFVKGARYLCGNIRRRFAWKYTTRCLH
jgi:hypothetical protein